MKKIFPCTQCGCCCKRVESAIKLGVEFPFKTKNDGSCEMLTEDNKCKVYDSRPSICNIHSLAKILGRNIDEFYKENIEACNKLMDQDMIPLKYRIK
jgi:hypothetical protein